MDMRISKRWAQSWERRQGAFGAARRAANQQDPHELARELMKLKKRSVDFESHAKSCILTDALFGGSFEEGAQSEAVLALLLSGLDSCVPCREDALSPLHLATHREASTLRAVAARASDLNATRRGKSPLSLLAYRYGSAEKIAVLLEAGADVNFRNEEGLSALDCCAQSGAIDAPFTARALILAGAHWESALELARPELYESWGESRKRLCLEWIAVAEAAVLERQAIADPTGKADRAAKMGKARL